MLITHQMVCICIMAMLLTGCAASNHKATNIADEIAMSKKSKTRLMHRVIDASIIIDAPVEEVWAVLVDFSSWGSWNEFIPEVKGTFLVGERLRIKVVSPGLKPMVFNPEIFEIKQNEAILWGGSFLGVIYRGDHTFLLEPAPGVKTLFRQIERFMGPMVLLMGSMIEKTKLGYHQMNRALKEQVEGSCPK